MPKQVALVARPRAGSGKGEARTLRRQGRVPAIAYGSDLRPTPVSVDALELWHALHTDAGLNAIIRLSLDGDDHLTLARELQRDPVRRSILHVDFVTVSRNVRVTVDVPLVLTGEAPGVAEGGVADQRTYLVPVEVLPLEVPEHLELDISDMQIGGVKRIEDLTTPPGVEVLEDPDTVVVSVAVPHLDVPETTAEEVEELGDETATDVEQALAESEADSETAGEEE